MVFMSDVEGPPIFVNAPLPYYGGWPHGGSNSGGYNGWDSNMNDHGAEAAQIEYPYGFDHALDAQVDALAAQIAAEMATKPNSNLIEYGAVIWRDAAGNVHRTTLAEGTTRNVDLSSIWGQIQGQILAIVHSHPTQYQAGILAIMHLSEQNAASA